MTDQLAPPITFSMPSLGADMEEGRITEWLVRPGDHVERGQIVVVVQTDKSDIEVEVFEPATIAELLVAEGDVVPVGTPIARLAPDRRVRPDQDAVEHEVAHDVEPAIEQPSHAEPHVTSPVLRHLANTLHVDATRLHGTGPGGRVVRDDILRAAQPARRASHVTPADTSADTLRITPRARRLIAEHGLTTEQFADRGLVTGADVLAAAATAARPAPAATGATTRQESMRRHIADLMTRSWREIPHYHVAQRLDLSRPMARLADTNAARPLADRIVPGALLLCAAARAAAKVPQCNGWWHSGRFEPAETVDLGLVLSLRGGGIIVPTIRHADRLAPDEMMRQMTELVQQARQGRLRSSHLGEASITVTSLGDRGADSVTGVIHPPQVALVGFGAVRDDVWPASDAVTVRPTVHASLAGDHRATDGLTGSRFLAQMQALLDGELSAELDAATTDPAGQEDADGHP